MLLWMMVLRGVVLIGDWLRWWIIECKVHWSSFTNYQVTDCWLWCWFMLVSDRKYWPSFPLDSEAFCLTSLWTDRPVIWASYSANWIFFFYAVNTLTKRVKFVLNKMLTEFFWMSSLLIPISPLTELFWTAKHVSLVSKSPDCTYLINWTSF